MTMLMLAALALAQASPAGPPVLRRLLDCRQVADRDARLACFDREAGTVADAQRTREIVVIDRAEAETRPIPRREAFEGVIASAGQRADGRWSFRLQDGSRWQQIESDTLYRPAVTGSRVEINPASMGTYFARIDRQRAIRVRQVGAATGS